MSTRIHYDTYVVCNSTLFLTLDLKKYNKYAYANVHNPLSRMDKNI